jgi:hypothetical protein
MFPQEDSMKLLSGIISACASFLLPFVAFAAQEDCKKPETTSVEIVKSRFGVIVEIGDSIKMLTVSKFPAIPSARYGWFLFYKTEKPQVVWREEIVAPAPIADWGEGEAEGLFTVSSDRKSAVTERISSSEFPLIEHSWGIGPEDPLGLYVVTVYIDGIRVAQYQLECNSA